MVTKTEQIDNGTWVLSFEEDGRLVETCCYLVQGEQSALIETGPSTMVDQVVAGLEALNLDPGRLDYIMLTHIHLDHAGGVGHLAAKMPRATVMVHPAGVEHLVAPEQLLASTKKARGEDSGVGTMLPVPRERIISATDGLVLNLGRGHELLVLETPGHAPHHLSFMDPLNRTAFTGEAAGVYYRQPAGFLQPAVAPPTFNRRQARASISKLASLNPERLCFSHFGPARPGLQLLERAMGQLLSWEDLITAAYRREPDFNYVLEELKAYELKAAGRAATAPGEQEQVLSFLPMALHGFLMDLLRHP